jgi:hypothetical protein
MHYDGDSRTRCFSNAGLAFPAQLSIYDRQAIFIVDGVGGNDIFVPFGLNSGDHILFVLGFRQFGNFADVEAIAVMS